MILNIWHLLGLSPLALTTRKHSSKIYTACLLTGKERCRRKGGIIQGLLSRKGWCCPSGQGTAWGVVQELMLSKGIDAVQGVGAVQGVLLSRGWCCPEGGGDAVQGDTTHNRKWYHNSSLPLWTEWQRNVKTLPYSKLRLRVVNIMCSINVRDVMRTYALPKSGQWSFHIKCILRSPKSCIRKPSLMIWSMICQTHFWLITVSMITAL